MRTAKLLKNFVALISFIKSGTKFYRPAEVLEEDEEEQEEQEVWETIGEVLCRAHRLMP